MIYSVHLSLLCPCWVYWIGCEGIKCYISRSCWFQWLCTIWACYYGEFTIIWTTMTRIKGKSIQYWWETFSEWGRGKNRAPSLIVASSSKLASEGLTQNLVRGANQTDLPQQPRSHKHYICTCTPAPGLCPWGLCPWGLHEYNELYSKYSERGILLAINLLQTHTFKPHVISILYVCIICSQDILLALGFKTYFVRVSTNESTIKDAKVITLSPTKKIPQYIEEDIPIENEVMCDVKYNYTCANQ